MVDTQALSNKKTTDQPSIADTSKQQLPMEVTQICTVATVQPVGRSGPLEQLFFYLFVILAIGGCVVIITAIVFVVIQQVLGLILLASGCCLALTGIGGITLQHHNAVGKRSAESAHHPMRENLRQSGNGIKNPPNGPLTSPQKKEKKTKLERKAAKAQRKEMKKKKASHKNVENLPAKPHGLVWHAFRPWTWRRPHQLPSTPLSESDNITNAETVT
ncbi:MAG: hypothetical protein LBP65_03755 [Puniceicoccales bacterium]|nr:hypothetical protein [Puniceicoccales bacterium]